MLKGFSWGSQKERAISRSRWEIIIIMDLKEMECCDMYCIYLPQNRDQWRALVNTVIILHVP
jgi:hypothetical protein